MIHRFAILFVCILSASLCVVASAQEVAKPSQPQQAQFELKPEIKAIVDQGKQLLRESKRAEALSTFQDALKKATETNDVYGQGISWQMIGNAYYGMGDLLKAQESFEKAKKFFEQCGDKTSEIGMKGNLAILKDNMGYPDEARPIYLELLEHYKKNNEKQRMANMYLNLAILENGVHHFELTLNYAREARALYREIGDKRWESAALLNIGNSLDDLGKYTDAIAAFEESIRLAREVGSKDQESSTLSVLGDVYRRRNDPLRALEMHQRAIQMRRELGDMRFLAKTLVALGVDYDILGQSQLAQNCIEEAITLARKTGDRPTLAYALSNYGVVLHQAKEFKRAEVALNESQAINRQSGNSVGEAICLGTLANIKQREKRYEEALKDHEAARKIFLSLNLTEEAATISDYVASIYAEQEKYEEAAKLYQSAIDEYIRLGNNTFRANTICNLADVQLKMNKYAEAERSLKTGIQLSEDVRSKLGASSEGKAALLGRRIELYRNYIWLLIETKRSKEAFDLAQKTKGRSLLDLLNQSNTTIQQSMTAEERAEEQALRRKADEINAAMVREGAQNEIGAKKRYAELKAELTKAEGRLAAFTTNLFIKHPGLARKRSAGTATFAQIVRVIPKDTVLIEYIAGLRPVVMVVTSNGMSGHIWATNLSYGTANIGTRCAQTLVAVSDPSKPYKASTDALYKDLIAPIESKLRGKKRLIICPDGPLWDVPFAALTNRKGFLAQQFEIDYAYSATGLEAALTARRLTRPTQQMLVVANPDFGGAKRFGDNPLIPGQRPIEPPSRPIEPPSRPIEPPSRPIEPPSRDLGLGLRGGIVDLPGTQSEADAIRKLYPSASVLTRENAQESSVIKSAGKYRYVHIASHAFFNDASPMLSSIVLATPISSNVDGYLTGREILSLNLNADLVVLSACNTARGSKNSGEGIVGLSWALFAAGAPAQIVSQWSVDDKATAILMQNFYRGLKKGQTKGGALRNASLSLLKSATGRDAKWKHPYYWAPFILLGDWR